MAAAASIIDWTAVLKAPQIAGAGGAKISRFQAEKSDHERVDRGPGGGKAFVTT
jgi:hypothetical protein